MILGAAVLSRVGDEVGEVGEGGVVGVAGLVEGEEAGDDWESVIGAEGSFPPRALTRPAPRSTDPLPRAVPFVKFLLLLVLPPWAFAFGAAITFGNANSKE